MKSFPDAKTIRDSVAIKKFNEELTDIKDHIDEAIRNDNNKIEIYYEDIDHDLLIYLTKKGYRVTSKSRNDDCGAFITIEW